jgi:phage baseplate assembly protein gpV
MQRAVQTIRGIARHEVEQRWTSTLALVKSVQGANGTSKYSCTVELRETGIVLPEVPLATSVIGAVSLPRENDLVVILFPGGDLHGAVVIGRLYTEEVSPPKNAQGEFVVVLPGDETATDKRLELRVETPGDGSRKLNLTLDGSIKIELSINDESIQLKAQDTQLTLTQTGSSDGKAELKAGDCKITMEQAGDVSIEATGTLKLKASKIELSGDTSIKIAGQTVEVN